MDEKKLKELEDELAALWELANHHHYEYDEAANKAASLSLRVQAARRELREKNA